MQKWVEILKVFLLSLLSLMAIVGCFFSRSDIYGINSHKYTYRYMEREEKLRRVYGKIAG
jgi:hypothetical protein